MIVTTTQGVVERCWIKSGNIAPVHRLAGMECHQRLDKPPRPEAIGSPRRSDGVGRALRETFAPVMDDTGMFRGLIDQLDRHPFTGDRGG